MTAPTTKPALEIGQRVWIRHSSVTDFGRKRTRYLQGTVRAIRDGSVVVACLLTACPVRIARYVVAPDACHATESEARNA